MRLKPGPRFAAPALCAALLLGSAAPALADMHGSSHRSSPAKVSSAPVPGADALLAQTKSLGDLGGVLKPVSDLLNAVLKADNGTLPAADATKLAQAVKAAIDAAKGAAPVPVPAPGAERSGSPDAAKRAADLKGDALTALQTAVDQLVKDSTAANVTAVATDCTAVVTALVNLLAATLLGSGLPAANLPGLPQLPSLPSLPAVSLPTGGA